MTKSTAITGFDYHESVYFFMRVLIVRLLVTNNGEETLCYSLWVIDKEDLKIPINMDFKTFVGLGLRLVTVAEYLANGKLSLCPLAHRIISEKFPEMKHVVPDFTEHVFNISGARLYPTIIGLKKPITRIAPIPFTDEFAGS